MSHIMKIFRSKRKASKKKRLSDESNDDQNQKAGPSSPIFKLTVDCCDEIFDYLSTKDLHSFGQTCTAIQKVAGEYFKRNFAGAENFTRDDGIYTCYYDHEGEYNKQTMTSGFNRYITNISHYYDHGRGPLHYIESHSDELDSVNNLYFVCTHVDTEKVKYFRKILPKIETLRINHCIAWYDMFNYFLKHCENVTNLWIQHDLGYIISREKNPWLLQNHPKLKRLHLGPLDVNEINGLVSFFERNPNVDIFSANYRCFWANRNQLMNSKAKLETLCVEDFHYDTIGNMHEICDLLKQLHEKGFYKRLHLNFRVISQRICDQIILVPGLERLHFEKYNKIYSVPQMVSLKELHFPGGLKANDIQILASNLVNLEQVTISSISSNDLLPFMRHSKKLRKLYVYLNERTLNLAKLNKEREKSANARNVIIYVGDDIFLATKWSTHYGETIMKLVEMRRINSV